MKFFFNCTNDEQAKDVYRKLVKVFHPDKGGDKELMIELQKQYDAFKSGERDTPIRNPYGSAPVGNNDSHAFGKIYSSYRPFDFRSNGNDQVNQWKINDLEVQVNKLKQQREAETFYHNHTKERLETAEMKLQQQEDDANTRENALDSLREEYYKIQQENHGLQQQLEIAKKIKPYPQSLWEYLMK